MCCCFSNRYDRFPQNALNAQQYLVLQKVRKSWHSTRKRTQRRWNVKRNRSLQYVCCNWLRICKQRVLIKILAAIVFHSKIDWIPLLLLENIERSFIKNASKTWSGNREWGQVHRGWTEVENVDDKDKLVEPIPNIPDAEVNDEKISGTKS